MNSVLSSLLTDYSPPQDKMSGLGILRAARPEAKPAPEPKPNLIDQQAERLRALEAKVRQEERDVARKNLEDALTAERRRHTEELEVQRGIWVEQEGARLSQEWIEAFANLEKALSDKVAGILSSFVGEALRQQTIAEFEQTLEGLLTKTPALITVTGPEDILSAIKNRMGPLARGIKFSPGADVEVTALAQDTTIRTQFEAWSTQLSNILKVDC